MNTEINTLPKDIQGLIQSYDDSNFNKVVDQIKFIDEVAKGYDIDFTGLCFINNASFLIIMDFLDYINLYKVLRNEEYRILGILP